MVLRHTSVQTGIIGFYTGVSFFFPANDNILYRAVESPEIEARAGVAVFRSAASVSSSTA